MIEYFLLVGTTGPLSNILQSDLIKQGRPFIKYGRNGFSDSLGAGLPLNIISSIKVREVIFLSSSLKVSLSQDDLFDFKNLPEYKLMIYIYKVFRFDRMTYLSSSGAIYGNFNGSVRDEESTCNPVSNYGMSKLYMENLVQDLSIKYNSKYLILRLSNPYGVYEKEIFDYGIIPYLIRCSQNNTTANIYASLSNHKDYININAFLVYFNFLLRKNDAEGIFNLASSSPTRLIDLIDIISNLQPSKLNFENNFKSNTYDADADADVGVISIHKIQEYSGIYLNQNLALDLKQLYEMMK